MPTFEITSPDGRKFQVTAPDGATQEEVLKYAQANMPAVQKVGNDLNSIPRQIGLTARNALEGGAEGLQFLTEPIRYIQDKLTPDRAPSLSNLVEGKPAPPKSLPLGMVASQFADAIGLPKPESSTERVAASGSKLGFGTMATLGLGNAMNATKAAGEIAAPIAAEATTLAGKVSDKVSNALKIGRDTIGDFLSLAPTSQVAASAGAGLAGGASKEAGGSPLQQGVSSAVGGVAGGLTPAALSGIGGVIKNAFASMKPAEMDAAINLVLQRAGVDYSQVPERARQALRKEMAGALNTGKDLDAAAVSRLLDFARTGLTPTRGMVTLDPVQITREKNLAKMAANSGDTSLHGLPAIENANNARAISLLNEAGAAKGDLFGAGSSVVSSIGSKDARLANSVTSLYDAARAMPGGDTPLNRAPIVNGIFEELAKDNKMAFLPENVSNMLNQISAGVVKIGGKEYPVPFNANTLDTLMTTIATAQRGTSDGNVKAALSAVRRGIEKADIGAPQFGGNQIATGLDASRMQASTENAQAFFDALKQAKGAAAARFGWQESAAPIEAALSGAQPDNFIRRFVIGGSLADAKAVAENAPIEPVKNAILAHLKEKALNGAADEVGKFSQAAYNKELLKLSNKLPLFFSAEEIDQLRALGRAASYAQAQPVGSAVNNSNSGALLLGRGLDALSAIAGKLPFGQSAIVEPLKGITLSVNSRQAAKVAPGLLAEQPKLPWYQAGVGPALGVGGLLAAP